jgi:hypothetical protein
MLPLNPRQAWLKSFWIALILSLGISLCGFLAAFGWMWSATIAATVCLTAGFLGLQCLGAVARVYSVWRGLNEWYVRAAAVTIKAVCFYLILMPLRFTGSRIELRPRLRHASLWAPMRSKHLESSLHQDGPYDNSVGFGWVRAYSAWARTSGNLWTIGLLPYLILLGWLESRHDISVPTQTYTLF